MSLLSRPVGFGPNYDSEGRLTGGLSALEELARVISTGNGDGSPISRNNSMDMDSGIPDSKDLPVSTESSIVSDASSDDVGDDSDDGNLEEIDVGNEQDSDHTLTMPNADSLLSHDLYPLSSSPEDSFSSRFTQSPTSSMLDSTADLSHSVSSDSHSFMSDDIGSSPDSRTIKRNSSSSQTLTTAAVVELKPSSPGDLIKRQFIDLKMVSTLLVSRGRLS